ncbi:hypothetical protein GCM10022243_06580 [Saccharothrix violaceirubra]|uniref:Uncharacterized protein n=1 Tax=Saccharothrix violaceirubra TaxID=413306 RepID=A0A7W7SY28_9PSEU|nr:DUF6461 domain-containing protein [Saccharothrix violaceirubra]MBB4963070.1 hypothetical protein [Saccharothrix violaceirubra]
MAFPEPHVADDAVDHYHDLLERDVLPRDAVCVAAVRGLSLDEALRRIDGFRSARRSTVADAGRAAFDAFPDELPLVVADEVDGWVLLIEDNGWWAASERVLRVLSAGTVVAGAYWNVNFDSTLALAVDGRVHDLDFVADKETVDPALTTFLDGLDFADVERSCAMALAFVERVSGVRITEEWATSPHPASVIADPWVFANSARFLENNAPELIGADVGRAAVEWACAIAGISPDADLPAVRELHRQALEARWDRCLPVETDRVRRLRRPGADAAVERRLLAKAHAVRAVEALRDGDITTVVQNACQVDQTRWPELRERLRRHQDVLEQGPQGL